MKLLLAMALCLVSFGVCGMSSSAPYGETSDQRMDRMQRDIDHADKMKWFEDFNRDYDAKQSRGR